jgi:DNA-directed RNA polymerase
MISICLRRKEHIPRAYQIFNQILLDVKGEPHRMPEAEVWAAVLEGVASLGQDKGGDETWKTWRNRADVLIGKWEAYNNVVRGHPALHNNGLKVYQGYLSGLLK